MLWILQMFIPYENVTLFPLIKTYLSVKGYSITLIDRYIDLQHFCKYFENIYLHMFEQKTIY